MFSNVTHITFACRWTSYFSNQRDAVFGVGPMSQNHMTYWIEIADERHFVETTMADRMQEFSESHFLHLGAKIVKIASWFQRSVRPRSLPVVTH